MNELADLNPTLFLRLFILWCFPPSGYLFIFYTYFPVLVVLFLHFPLLSCHSTSLVFSYFSVIFIIAPLRYEQNVLFPCLFQQSSVNRKIPLNLLIDNDLRESVTPYLYFNITMKSEFTNIHLMHNFR